MELVLRQHRPKLSWLANEPGAWGYLAGQAVLAERRRLRCPLSERERRIVWQTLWDRLVRAAVLGAPAVRRKRRVVEAPAGRSCL
ncbi:MAG: hypothetical protein U0531_01690 [Dehalococcoidia bacterium]